MSKHTHIFQAEGGWARKIFFTFTLLCNVPRLCSKGSEATTTQRVVPHLTSQKLPAFSCRADSSKIRVSQSQSQFILPFSESHL